MFQNKAKYERKKILLYEYILLLIQSDKLYILFPCEMVWILSSPLSWNDLRS